MKRFKKNANQTIFTKGQVKQPPQIKVKINLAKLPDKIICPYCAHRDKLTLFAVQIKTGISKKQVQCPSCNAKMRRTTILDTKTIEDWAIWIYYARVWEDFRNPKIKWDKIKAFLKRHQLSNIFWEAYYAEKTKDQGEPIDTQKMIDKANDTSYIRKRLVEQHRRNTEEYY